MIKSTFLNLSESKKQRVISAIIDEFAREDTNRVSINNIIEQANISRGSFYQYFDDKMDLVEVVFHYYAEQCVSEISKVIDISRGDIFYTYEECFSIMAELGKSKRNKAVFRKVFSGLYDPCSIVSEFISKRYQGLDEIDSLKKQLSRKNLKSQDDDFFRLVNAVLMTVLKRCVREYFINGGEYEIVKKSYLKQVDIVKSGAVA